MPTPLVVQVMQDFRAGLLRKEAENQRAMAAQWLRVERGLMDKVEEFTERVNREGLTAGQIASRRFQLERYQDLLAQARRAYAPFAEYAAGATTAHQSYFGRAGIQLATTAIKAVGSEAGVRIALNVLPVEAIQNMVGLGVDGSPLRELFDNAFGAGANGMLEQLIQSTARGTNPKVTARNMVRMGLAQSFHRALVIDRTEQLRVHREATRLAYQNSGVVENYRRLATRDRRTCIGCLVADGEVYDLEETLREHPQGRCTLLPVVSGLKPVEWEKGKDWLTRQSPAIQRQILGRERFNLWNDGKADLEEMIDLKPNTIWGDHLAPTRLSDLVARRGIRYQVRGLPERPPVAPPEPPVAPPPKPKRERKPKVVAPEPAKNQREVAPEFKKTKEAQDWARQRFPTITINYGKLAPETANTVNQTLLDTFSRVPQLEQRIRYIGSSQARNQDIKDYFRPTIESSVRNTLSHLTKEQQDKFIEKQLNKYVQKIPGEVYAYSHGSVPGTVWERFNGININEKYGKNFANMTQSLRDDELTGWHPIGSGSVKGVIDHELGHEIDKLLGLIDSKDRFKITDPGLAPIIQQIQSMPGGVAGNLSRYATTNYKEIIAEAWAEYINNPNPRQPAQLIGDYITQRASNLP